MNDEVKQILTWLRTRQEDSKAARKEAFNEPTPTRYLAMELVHTTVAAVIIGIEAGEHLKFSPDAT